MQNVQTIPLPKFIKLVRSFDFPHKFGILDRLYGKSLAAHGICWADTAADIAWKLDLKNPTLRWIVYGKYEGPSFLNWARKFLPADGIVVDSGANIGQVLLYIAQWIPQGKVLAFEPSSHAADWLNECLSANPNLPVEIIRRGLGTKRVRLYLKDEGMTAKHGAQGFVSETEGTPIDIVPLADELHARSIAKVDLWKLDVEGYELEALQGADEFFNRKAIRAVYADSNANGQKIRDYLTSKGYKCYSISDNGTLIKVSALPADGTGLFLPS